MSSTAEWIQMNDPSFSAIHPVQHPIPDEYIVSQPRDYASQPAQHQHHHQQQQQLPQDGNQGVPSLAELLSAVGDTTKIGRPLFHLLSGIVAAVEVANDKVQSLSTHYQELSLEVATISRVVYSSQLGDGEFGDAKSNPPKYQQPRQTTPQGGRSSSSSFMKKLTSSSLHSTATPPSSSSSSAPSKTFSVVPTQRNINSSRSTTGQQHQQQQQLAAESVSALHSHAVAELEGRLDALASRIGRLQEDVGIRSREAMEKAYSDVAAACDIERQRTEEAMRGLAKTFEGQAAVRLAELFSDGEARLSKTAEEAYISLRTCGAELATSFAQTGKAFVESTGEAVQRAVSSVTQSCASVVLDARDTVVSCSHEVIAKNYEAESRLLLMFQSAEEWLLSSSSSSSSKQDGSSRSSHPTTQQQEKPPSKNHIPSQFRCCSAVEEVRALYRVLGIDGGEAVRIFKSHFAPTAALFSSSASSASGGGGGRLRPGALSQGEIDSLNLLLRIPALRCFDPLPQLGLRVSDSPPPTEGAEVVYIDHGQSGSRAARAGLRVGDIILRVDGRELGHGAASRGGLHLALLIAPGRPLQNGVRQLLTSASSSSTTLPPTTTGDAENRLADSSSSSAIEGGVRWAPDPRHHNHNNTNNNTNTSHTSSSATTMIAPLSTNNNSNMIQNSASGSGPCSGSASGVVLTVYRYRDALTFNCTLNLDPF